MIDKTASPPIPDGREHRSNLATPSTWKAHYGDKHRLQRVSDFPDGIVPPRKVRIYRRTGHYVLQWWDPPAKGNLSDRVDGDLVTAIARARQIEQRLSLLGTAGATGRRLGHEELISKYLANLEQRADAGEIDPRTVVRFGSALGHYRAFVDQTAVQAAFPNPAKVNRPFQLEFAAFLNNLQISPNGHEHTSKRPMRSPGFVLDAVRAMYEWATDPERGNLLPEGFRNPFRHAKSGLTEAIGEPDITTTMARDFVAACDAYQLNLFVSLLFFGLRAAEPCFLFREHLEGEWLKAACIPALGYWTKSRRHKRFPLIDCLQALWHPQLAARSQGLLYCRRDAVAGRRFPLFGASLTEMITEFEDRCRDCPHLNAALKAQLRDQLFKEAGGITYDQIEAEFGKIARRLSWPSQATVKDFRHLFSTCMENAGVPEHYRKYLMGQSPGKAAIVTYTHLNKIREHYEAAVRKELQPLVTTVWQRIGDLGLVRVPA